MFVLITMKIIHFYYYWFYDIWFLGKIAEYIFSKQKSLLYVHIADKNEAKESM